MDSKLENEISELLQNNVITRDVAQNILAYYQSKKAGKPNRLFVIFGVLGAVLVGLGLILILAHNWDQLSKWKKTIFAFSPLFLAQILAGYTILKNKSRTWIESIGTFLFFTIGSSIALVAQIYNISGDLSSYLFTWTVLAIPMIYLMRSNALALLCLVYATYYAVEEGYSLFNTSSEPWWYFVLILAIAPFYLRMLKLNPKTNMTSVFNWLFPLSLVLVLGAFVRTNDELGLLMYVILFGLLYNIGQMPLFNTQKLRRNGYLILGSIGTVVMLLIFSFDVESHDVRILKYNMPEFQICLVLTLMIISVLVYSYFKNRIKVFNPFQYVFVFMISLVLSGFINTTVFAVTVNALVLTLGLFTIKIGTEKRHLGILNYGLSVITALVVCRFFDTDMSFVIRGVLFVCVGSGFFIANYAMLKRQKNNIS
ncbi:MAG: DUF2157 domain-containing protein [Flavobacteriaceae bacterium]|nr:DUF2157 domain-containing protein [Flavobacteriaceae bacterium]